MSEWTSGSTFKFEEPGAEIYGTISDLQIIDGFDMSTPPKPEKQRIIDLDTDTGEAARIYVKKGSMQYELGQALRTAGLKAPQVGHRLSIKFERTEPATTKGYSPRKVYSVGYKVVEVEQSGSDLL